MCSSFSRQSALIPTARGTYLRPRGRRVSLLRSFKSIQSISLGEWNRCLTVLCSLLHRTAGINLSHKTTSVSSLPLSTWTQCRVVGACRPSRLQHSKEINKKEPLYSLSFHTFPFIHTSTFSLLAYPLGLISRMPSDHPLINGNLLNLGKLPKPVSPWLFLTKCNRASANFL